MASKGIYGTPEWRSYYQRVRLARNRLSFVRARNELGRDIQTGMRYAEVERLAELKLALREAAYDAFMASEPEAAIDAFESLVLNIVSTDRTNATPEFAGALDDMLRDAQQARAEWEEINFKSASR